MNKLLVLLLTLFSIIKISFAQDTIITIDGEQIFGKSVKLNSATRECFYQTMKGKEKEIDMDDIFSVRDSMGTETVYYRQDTTKGFYDSQNDMQQYIEGILAARKQYKSNLFTYLGAGLSVTAVAVVAASGTGLLFWTPLIPVVYSGIVLKSKPNVEKITNSIPEHLRSEKYVTGYITQVKKKRTNNAVIGSVGGLLLGWLGFFSISAL